MIPPPGPQWFSNGAHKMPASGASPGGERQGRSTRSVRNVPEAYRVLDWTSLDSPPTSMDITRMASLGGRDGGARLAILVNTPRMLRAANVFAEQAGIQGAQVRGFVDSKEALAWLYKGLPSGIGHDLPAG